MELLLQSTVQRILLVESFRESLMRSNTVCSFCFWAISDWVTSATFSFSPSSFSGEQDSDKGLVLQDPFSTTRCFEENLQLMRSLRHLFNRGQLHFLPKSFCRTCPSYRSSARSLTMILSPTRTSFIQSINTYNVKIKHFCQYFANENGCNR